ncbi:hypothetical protein GLOTRDRAFT_74634 [Gloeophyllum trabeum ATCC 11539]|uniref:histidine kinase n=1 Tax=Gloeophyllum trabeum (strain ATCC 11539 / FP-39264 / Madison 617) TaxID=670483 RepID=S7RST0_GLOTA|nr:uncharacterized protein GLOTRDRAFT_74634 [Gloeophyllum trabeum ATCC 11539]EPQ56119.1 hypothetical protein GLOTRDRAFT_74634 [Gloeophyllum trabeum ATCC 11539]
MLESAGEGSYRRPFPGKSETFDDDGTVDEVVVDRAWSEEIKSSATQSEHGGSPEKTGSHQQGGTNTDHESFIPHPDGFWAYATPLIILRWRVWPAITGFFDLSFFDERSEQHYRKENWFVKKPLAIWASLFYVLNWALALGLIPGPLVLADKIFYYGICTAVTVPLPFMVIYDWPRDQNVFYQVFLCFSTWCWSYYQVVFMYACGFYTNEVKHSYFTCGNKDFLGTFYWTAGLATISLFGLKQHRLPHMIGAAVFFILACVLILPDRHTWTRNLINHFVYQSFLLYVHYMRENAERRLYTLRDQLKIQFRATQKAQINERKAADSKRRLTSYVFHEVRVPLNTALLAVQNMEAAGAVPKSQQIEFKALEGSLSMMSKVLNDVLDFNRMDSGRFESVSKPYAFHQVMRSMLVPLQLATDARNLTLETEFDENIDLVARRAAYEAMGHPPQVVEKLMEENSEEHGIVCGDETRLRQIITNLASNACKFTQSGGKLSVKTRLILPSPESTMPRSSYGPSRSETDATDVTDSSKLPDSAISDAEMGLGEKVQGHHVLSATHLSQHNLHHSQLHPLEWIVVRIEVTDTGCGIKPKDMVQSKLFSAFNQTEQGRQQGGKGTGLGLALVRQIVKLSRGRLGVRSKAGEGSTFWVELPLGVGAKTMQGFTPPPNLVERADELGLNMTFAPESSHSGGKPSRTSANKRNSSAFTTIMEQGGMVELVPSKPGETPVLTRALGDANTGTAPRTSTPPEIGELSSPESLTPTEIQRTTVRPSHVDLPRPRQFTSYDFTNPSTSSSATLDQLGSTPSSNQSAPATPPAEFERGLPVLVVDDDPLTRMLMKRLLTRIGCRVSTAENGEVALEMILGGSRPTPSSETPSSQGSESSQGIGSGTGVPMAEDTRFAAVFLDNQMPVMSGLDTVARLREAGRQDFVVGVTGNALLTDQEEYLQAGVDHVLTKPVLEKSLRNMLHLADERRKRALLDFHAPSPS